MVPGPWAWILDHGPWVSKPGPWTLGLKLRTQDLELETINFKQDFEAMNCKQYFLLPPFNYKYVYLPLQTHIYNHPLPP